MTPRPLPCRELRFAGDPETEAEVRRLLPALASSDPTSNITIKSITSLSWSEAQSRIDALLVVPDTSTWTRSRHRRPTGPQPVRDRNWPWGLPWLKPRDRDQVEQHNASLRRLFEHMEGCIRHYPSAPLIFLHPEDLGAADHGVPASIWQLPEIRMWANRWGLKRYATHQCNFGASPWPFPLGVLSSHPLPHILFRPGWPRLDPKSMKYIGPLPRSCGCVQGYHKRDSDFQNRHLRRRAGSIVQSDVLKFLIEYMFNLPTSFPSAMGLSSRGSGQYAAQAELSSELDVDSEDPTDDERASLEEEVLLGVENNLDSAHRAALDSPSLRALGIQNLREALARDTRNSDAYEGFDTIGEVRDRPGYTGDGDQSHEAESAQNSADHSAKKGTTYTTDHSARKGAAADYRLDHRGLLGAALDGPEGQVKKKKKHDDPERATKKKKKKMGHRGAQK